MFCSSRSLAVRLRSWCTAVCLGLLAAGMVHAQIPTKCFEIESILVDACNGGCAGAAEGENEMVRFITGPDAIATSDIRMQFYSNGTPFQGIAPGSPTTAALTAALNATITSCGYLVEPPGDIIPPGSQVLFVTSTDMCVASNSFSALSDTLYLIFQTAGNTQGHFKNNNAVGQAISPTPGPPLMRWLRMRLQSTSCGDTVTYDADQLTNIYGTYGGTTAENDGATANFTWPGAETATYTNFGCQAPFIPVTVTITSGGGNITCGGTTTLVGEVGGNPSEIFWSGGGGTFSASTSTTTDYTLGTSDAGTVTLTLNAVSTCGDTVRATVDLNVQGSTAPTITASGPTTFCTGGSVTLTASGSSSYLWNTSEPTASITVTTGGVYTVTGTTACGSTNASITITVDGGVPSAAITGDTTICADGSTVLTASGGGTYLWSNSLGTPSITASAPGLYTVQVSNACGSSNASVTVVEVLPTAAIAATPVTGAAPLAVTFSGSAVPDATVWDWDLGDLNGTTGQLVGHTYTAPGEYTVTLVTSGNGCNAQAQIIILVVDEVPSTVVVPNVFSPNNDGKNDGFKVLSTGLASLEVLIFNRWGQEVASIDRVDQSWSGRSDAGDPLSEGTYFYVLKAAGLDGKTYDLHGSVTLLR